MATAALNVEEASGAAVAVGATAVEVAVKAGAGVTVAGGEAMLDEAVV